MKFLLDANVLIPLEPAEVTRHYATTDTAAEFFRLCLLGSHIPYLHPALEKDLASDADQQRAEMRRHLLKKYSFLPHRTYVSQLERGLKSPSLDSLEKLAARPR